MKQQEPSSHRMQCLEVWGGNHAVDTAVVMSGLDAWVYSKPYRGSDAGGGDVHYVSSCASGRLTRLLLADVSGHGEDAAEVATQLRQIMRRYVNVVNPSQFVREMNSRFTADTETGRFATALVATYFMFTRTLTLCNAGHPSPLLYRAASKTWSLVEANRDERPHANLPLGVEGRAVYEPMSLRLEKDDCVLCCTDSLIEACGPDGRQIGSQGLLDRVRSLDISDPRSAMTQLLDRLSADAADNLDRDDVTLLWFRPNGEGVSLWNTLVSPIRVFSHWLSLRRKRNVEV